MIKQINSAENKKDSVYSLLKSRIISRKYAPGHKFPNEPELSKELGIGRITLRAALDRLEKTGLVLRSPGKGTFVAPEGTEKKGLKKFLLITYPADGIQYPASYIIPSIIKTCTLNDVDIETLPVEFLRSLPEEHALKSLENSAYDGFILDGSFYLGTETEVKILKALNKPVIIDHAKPGDELSTGFATMHANHKQAWGEAAKHLLEQGHRNILSLGHSENVAIKNLRGFEEKEYLDFLASLGANPDPSLLRFLPYNYSGLTKLIAEAVKSTQSPTAILCFSDFFAMHVYESLKSLSMKIPDDIAVMGYCGYPGARMMDPPLSTIDCDYAGIGKMAAEMLLRSNEWFGKEGPPPCIISPHRLIARESTQNKKG